MSFAFRKYHSQDIQEILIHTGQHYDPLLSKVFFDDLGLPQPNYQLETGSLSHGAQTAKMLEGIEKILIQEKPNAVLVYGDTNSTLAGALAAAKLQIPVAHIEAGLRSFNRKMPEEINRVLTDHIADILFAPTDAALSNLENEGIGGKKVIKTGDIMLDASLMFSDIADKKSDFLNTYTLEPKKYILATIHRAENTDNKNNLSNILTALESAAGDEKVIVPLHPRTKHLIERYGFGEINSKIDFVEPLGYFDMVKALKNARIVLTDSGGVQKEAYFYQVPCLTLRNETEWTELVDVGINRLVDVSSKGAILQSLEETFEIDWTKVPALYGQGDTALNIARHLLTFLNE